MVAVANKSADESVIGEGHGLQMFNQVTTIGHCCWQLFAVVQETGEELARLAGGSTVEFLHEFAARSGCQLANVLIVEQVGDVLPNNCVALGGEAVYLIGLRGEETIDCV